MIFRFTYLESVFDNLHWFLIPCWDRVHDLMFVRKLFAGFSIEYVGSLNFQYEDMIESLASSKAPVEEKLKKYSTKQIEG